MVRKFIASTGLVLALATQPVAAQDAGEQEAVETAFEQMAAMYAVELLTAEQEARLPLAQQVMERMMPPGAMSEILDGMMGGTLGPLMAEFGIDADDALLEAIGYSQVDLGISDEKAERILAIIDPAWRDRQEATNAYSQAMTRDMMAIFEPIMRDAMAEVYAIHFTDVQLRDINSFFATESGAAFARQSVTVATDPRLMAAIFSQPELLMGSVMGGLEGMESAHEGIPQARSYGELSARERASLAELTGLSAEDLQWTLASGDAARIKDSGSAESK